MHKTFIYYISRPHLFWYIRLSLYIDLFFHFANVDNQNCFCFDFQPICYEKCFCKFYQQLRFLNVLNRSLKPVLYFIKPRKIIFEAMKKKEIEFHV